MEEKKPKKPARETLALAHTRILAHLGRYRFLTVSQLARLGVSNDRSHLNKLIAGLREFHLPLVESANYGAYPKLGKLESVHSLTPKGRQFLLEELRLLPEEVVAPARKVQHHRDYFHRQYTLDFQIALDKWTGENRARVLLFDVYFDRVKGQRGGERAKTKLDLGDDRYLIADGIFMLETFDKKRHLYCLEIYNGLDVGRTVRQLAQHLDALEVGAASEAYGHDKANRVLCVFEEQRLLDSVRQALHTDPLFALARPFFLFKTLSEIQNNERFDTWVGVDGRPVNLF